MSLVVAVPLGMCAATVYGTSIVVQHRHASRHADAGDTNAASLLSLTRNPIWVAAVLSDFIGFLLQAGALSTGSVVVVQPLVVLMLPVAVLVSFLLGWHRPQRGDLLAVLAILAGLALFLILSGTPDVVHVPRARYLGMMVIIVLLSGVVVSLLVTGRNKVLRGAVYGAVAGGYFGALAVLVDAASEQVSRHGWTGLVEHPRGIVPLAGMVLLGTAGIILTQMSFQLGTLHATLPANLAADPLTGVLLGVIVLRERIPIGAGHLIAYVACLAAVAAGAYRLADPNTGPIDPDEPDRLPA